MRVKRYIVDSMPDALHKIRVDLGKDAVILNTKEVRTGGFLGMFGKKRIEVIAATDESAEISEAPSAPAPKPPASYKSPVNAAASYAAASPKPVKRKPSVAVMETAEHLKFPEIRDNAADTEERLSAPAVEVREDLLLDEIRQMKALMHKLSSPDEEAPALPEPFQMLEARMVEQEVEPSLARQLVDKALQATEERGAAAGFSETYEYVAAQLLGVLRPDEPKPIATDTRIAHFVGPTGVGKTTTIAKLAAEQVLKHRRKVGFITSDTYRIAAVEQLKTYATILNVPLEVVFSPQDLGKAFQNLEDCDIIFMDTAGRNFRNEMYVSELNALLGNRGKSETFLVLSLTMKYKDMQAITSNFNKFTLNKVLFTKMDETDTYGSIVNLVHDFSLSLSYVTYGQNVPDDISQIDEQRLIARILGEQSDE